MAFFSKKTVLVVAAALLLNFSSALFGADLYLRPTGLNSVLQCNNAVSGVRGELGYGLALGCTLGRESQFAVGGEVGRTEFKGFYRFRYSRDGEAKVPATYDIISHLAAFRYSLLKKSDLIRPYCEVLLGFSDVNVSSPVSRSSVVSYQYGSSNQPIELHGVCPTAGVGVGVYIQLARKTFVGGGYRYMRSGNAHTFTFYGGDDFANYDFYYNAHVMNLFVEQRF